MKKQNPTSKGQIMSIVNKEENTSQNSNSPEELVKRTPVGTTGFIIIEYENKRFVTLGKYKLTEPSEKSFEELEAEWSIPNWDKIIHVATVISHHIKTTNI